MFDADDPGTVINEFLMALFVPGIVLFVALWAAFRLVFDEALRSMGLVQIEAASGAGAVAAGYGRFFLLIVVTAALLLPYVAAYRWLVRDALRARGIV